MNELQFAESIARGETQSGSKFGNSFYVSARISSTGTAFRPAHAEFVNRDPAIWLGLELQRRWIGAPLLAEHPPGGILDGASFRASVIGIVIFTFVRGSDLYGIARIFDTDVAKAITASDSGFSDTSPSVTFAPDQMATIPLADGSGVLRVEGIPDLIDHLAICNLGVWSKGAPASGVDKAESGQ